MYPFSPLAFDITSSVLPCTLPQSFARCSYERIVNWTFKICRCSGVRRKSVLRSMRDVSCSLSFPSHQFYTPIVEGISFDEAVERNKGFRYLL